jgi:hypothetical protein
MAKRAATSAIVSGTVQMKKTAIFRVSKGSILF